MTTQTRASAAERLGLFKGELLSHSEPQEVIGVLCKSMKKSIPKHNSLTVKYRRWLPIGATTASPNIWVVEPSSYVLTEGETPPSGTVTPQDITAVLQQYGVLKRYTDVVADSYEDDIPAEMVKLCGEEVGLIREKIRWGVLKAGTNVYRGGGVAARTSIIARVSANLLRNVARGLSANLAIKITDILPPSTNVGTSSVEAAFVVVCHTDMEADLRSQLSTFTHISDYGSRRAVHENELGSYDQFRFVSSPHLNPYLSAGGTTAAASTVLAAAGTGGVNGAGTEAADVYPMIVLSEEAYGDVTMRGMDSFSAYHRKPGGGEGSNSSTDDPLGQRGHVGAKFYMTAVRLNELRMAVVEVACGALIS